jgi:hypothetical protein
VAVTGWQVNRKLTVISWLVSCQLYPHAGLITSALLLVTKEKKREKRGKDKKPRPKSVANFYIYLFILFGHILYSIYKIGM